MQTGFGRARPASKDRTDTGATIEGNAIPIEGFIYAADFPKVAAEIKASQDALGFSYEARNLYTNDPDANPCVITDCVFTSDLAKLLNLLRQEISGPNGGPVEVTDHRCGSWIA